MGPGSPLWFYPYCFISLPLVETSPLLRAVPWGITWRGVIFTPPVAPGLDEVPTWRVSHLRTMGIALMPRTFRTCSYLCRNLYQKNVYHMRNYKWLILTFAIRHILPHWVDTVKILKGKTPKHCPQEPWAMSFLWRKVQRTRLWSLQATGLWLQVPASLSVCLPCCFLLASPAQCLLFFSQKLRGKHCCFCFLVLCKRAVGLSSGHSGSWI